MVKIDRYALFLVLFLFAAPGVGQAQQLTSEAQARTYTAERHLITATLETIVAVLQETTLEHDASGLGERLSRVTDRLSRAVRMTAPSNAEAVSKADLGRLRRLLHDVAADLKALRDELEDEGEYDLADRLAPLSRDLGRAVREADHLADGEEDTGDRVTVEDSARWLRPGRYGDDRHGDDRYGPEERDEEDDEKDRRDDWRDSRWRHYAGTVVGEFSHRWPYRRETALYRDVPAIRYNRVEGFVLGIGRAPMTWESYGRARLYGQVGYAFALDEWRFTVGLETRLDNRRNDDFGLKVGGAYRFNTDTKDRWKTSWLENSLAAFFFENDFFDYHEVEGWTVYAVQRLTPYVQLSAGYRQEDHRSLDKNTGWSLFDGDGFPLNPPADEGRMQTLAFALEGGRVVGLHSLPRGAAFRLVAEVGEGLGGDFSFNRYVADGRIYVPVTRASSFGMRLRGGLAEGDFVPFQRAFTLGGLGSVRAYGQNAFLGTRMLLANAEYIIDGIDLIDDVFDDLQLLGFFDAGWVNAFGTDAFDVDDVLPAAGFGVGLDDRTVRLELAFPLRDLGGGRDPTLWLRITPNF